MPKREAPAQARPLRCETASDFQPPVDTERIRAWHDSAYDAMRAAGEQTVDHLGLAIVVPPGVF
ncbi:hypothetical protein [Actinophytocola oryzae]|uniref:Uncharacterized protein n=1 Tax=Actinophytocola oryzae TaxID=502181 RepID=A0A4R7UWJ2_9PSEU|nr:hypothetical protein [Actinophytocola oryzae]TDV38621.1 hypothetical protein CLV71_1266 [Actinophytocola oryzae]